MQYYYELLYDAMWKHYDEVILVEWGKVLKGEFLMDQMHIVTNAASNFIIQFFLQQHLYFRNDSIEQQFDIIC